MKTDYQLSNETYLADKAWEAGNRWVQTSNRWEKLDFLMETASSEFKDQLVQEMVRWMGEDDYNEFFNHLRRNWGVLTKPELEYEMNS
jgi:hypothetical protein